MIYLKKYSLALLGGVLLVLISMPVHAEVGLSVNHRLLIADSIEDETLVTLEVSVANTGSTSLSEATLTLISPIQSVDSATSSLSIGALAEREKLEALWHFTVPGTEQISSIMEGCLDLEVSVTDQSGETTNIQVMSIGGGE